MSQDAEFGTLARWTAEAVAELGSDHAIPAGCKGSGGPGALAWLAESMVLAPGDVVLDAGAGVGGSAAWLALHWGVRPLCLEPMADAVAAAVSLFGLPGVVASATAMPVADDAVDAAWSLGVLCTLTDKPAALRELRRVVRPGGRVGLLVYAATRPVANPPEGNDFPDATDVPLLAADAGLHVERWLDGTPLLSPPDDWQRKAGAVDDLVAAQHGDDPVLADARAGAARLGELLDDGTLRPVLLVARV